MLVIIQVTEQCQKIITFCSSTITGHKLPSAAMSTINIALHHNVTTVGQPNEQTPNMFSIVNMTEKVMDPEIVDSTLLPSQRNTDARPAMDDTGQVKASPQQEMDNEKEEPFMLKYTHLLPMAKWLGPESGEDELSSSEEVVNKEFDKKEVLLRFQQNMTEVMTEVISKLLEQPAKTHGNKKCKKNLHDREAKHLTHDTGMGSVIMQSRATSQCSGNIENVIHHLVRSGSEVSERV